MQLTATTLKISVSKYELFNLVRVEQFWHAIKYGTDAGYSILRIPHIYPEIVELEQLGYQPFETKISEQAELTIVCARYYRVLPADTTLWLLRTGQSICVD